MTKVITKAEQERLLARVSAFAGADEHLRHAMVLALVLVLKDTAPTHWKVNLDCGRVDRLFANESKTRVIRNGKW